VGLHPNEIINDKSGKFVYVTNSNSDNVTVINTTNDEITETISVRLQPEINPFFGDSPDGLCLSPDGRILYVANGMDNALAVIELGKDEYAKALNPKSKVIGFIPTGAYPSGIAISDKGNLYVSNLEAEGARLGIHHARTANLIYNSHNMMASISVIPVPGKKKLDAYTDTVIAVNNLSRAMSSREKPRESVRQNLCRKE